ncbi:MAG: DNA repair protein RadC [Candidatus Omnitrophica bacterium]|nr:DNA repair protein RadC [Candidatus Omnitrophota bacterium]
MRSTLRHKPDDRLTVLDLPAMERPRERLTQFGAEALSDQELLCCILGRGSAGDSVTACAQRLLHTFGGLRGLAEASIEQLSAVRGIGAAKAAQLKASTEVARRLLRADQPSSPSLDTAEAAAALVRPHLFGKKKEHVVALLLDTRHRPIRLAPIAVGSLSASLVHPRELFKEAILASAAAIIVAHNHPSGDPQPSEHDLILTRRLVQAGRLLGIEVLDHLIIADRHTVSLRATGIIARASSQPPREDPE